jgi:Holliday junction resolvase
MVFMPKINSRTKGKTGEREVINKLKDYLGDDIELSRNLMQTREGGHDITGLPYALEVKRCEKLQLDKWWMQTLKQAREAGLIPALAYRRSREQWQVLVPAYVLDPDYRQYHWSEDIQFTIKITIEMFAHLIRESVCSGEISSRK